MDQILFGRERFWICLKKHGIKVDFLVLGKWGKIYPEIIKEVFDCGHLIGNHGYSHSKTIGDFEKCEEIIFEITNQRAKFIRPAYLDVSLCSNCELAKSGKAIIIGSDVYPQDWKNNTRTIIKFVRQNVQNGSIILLHDGSNYEEELKTRPRKMFAGLSEIINNLKIKFEFCRLDEMRFD